MKKRTTKTERAENARMFYQNAIKMGKKAAIVVQREESTMVKTRFIGCCSRLALSEPKVLAESTLGIDGCFRDFLQAIKPKVEIPIYYNSSEFTYCLENHFGIFIEYYDGLVFVLCNKEN